MRVVFALLAVEVGPAVVAAAAVLGAETLVRGPRLDQRSVHGKMLFRQQRLDLRMVQKFAHELGKHRAVLQPIAVLREGSRVPDRGVGRKTHEPAVQEIDGTSSGMAWACTGGRFDWYYALNETVPIISGEVFVTDENGKIHRLGPGDMAFFPAGSH